MSGNRALRRAVETSDVGRLTGKVPLITDHTDLITPLVAQEMLKKNTFNRPINWKKVEEYADVMKNGGWKLTSQGIVFDENGVLLTGQQRLWAVIYSDTAVYMRVSRGCPSDTVRLLDRGAPQTSKDLAARETKRKHTSVESSIARAMLVMNGKTPTTDAIANLLIEQSSKLLLITDELKGTKKTKGILMISAAICIAEKNIKQECKKIDTYVKELESALYPSTSEKCWGRGIAFTMALEQAKKIIFRN